MAKHCTIKLKDGEKEVEFNMDVQPENELVIIDGIFRFFGIEVEYEEVASKQLAIQKMYKEYYSEPANFRNETGSAEQAEFGEMDSFLETIERIQKTTESPLPNKENPGMKRKNGKYNYRCNYRCEKCKHAGNHYIPQDRKSISCHQCGYSMEVQQVNPDFLPDDRFNYFVAGLKRKKEN